MAAFLSWATLEFTVSKRTAKAKTPRRSSKSSCPWLSISPNGSNLNFEDFLTFRLTRLTNALRTNLTKRYLEEFELSLPEWRLLAMIARFAPMRFSEVTSRSSMDKGQVSRTLRVMEKRGLTKMKTIKGAASDALAAPVMVSITPKGAALYKAVLPAARRRQAEMILSLSESERLRLYETIDKLSATIGHAVVSQDESE
jgi:DNA-binding MarR family transcriptional regulator